MSDIGGLLLGTPQNYRESAAFHLCYGRKHYRICDFRGEIGLYVSAIIFIRMFSEKHASLNLG